MSTIGILLQLRSDRPCAVAHRASRHGPSRRAAFSISMLHMKMAAVRFVCPAIVSLFVLITSLVAQTVQSPEVHSDRTVTFRLMAPLAQSVEVRLDDASDTKAIAMAKDATGLWAATSKQLTADVYSYSFMVDTLAVIDPNVHEFVPNHFEQGGLFTVPGSPAQPWEPTDVPHGEVHHHIYRSRIVGDQRDFYIYTPPGFDPKGNVRYPVLYLLHGYSDMADAWTTMGKANFIIDNLIAQGKAKAMIVVMPLGYGAPEILKSGWKGGDEELWQHNMDRFVEVLLAEVIPQIEQGYPVIRDRKSRAVAGLSMGGGEAFLAGLKHLDLFAWIAPMSAAILGDPDKVFPPLDAREASKIKLLWIACGKQDGLLKDNRNLKAWLTSKRIKFTDVETDGAHTWQVWRRDLVELVPLLFR
jgi:enterochelin esterase-like enzyme